VYYAVNLLTHVYQYGPSVLYLTSTATDRTSHFPPASRDV